MYDIIIIGAGPSGLTAAIYSARAGKKVCVIESTAIGGQIASSPKVENFPTRKSISGIELGDMLFDQVTSLGVDFELEEVKEIEKNGKYYKLVCENTSFDTKSVIIATGAKYRNLGLENEKDFVGEGIAYCAVCDGEFYTGKNIAIVGGGNAALQNAIYLSNICKNITIIQNLDFLTGEKTLINEVIKKDNVKIILGTIVTKLIGDKKLNSIIIKNKNNEKEIKIDGLFVSIGQIPNTKAFVNTIEINDNGYIVSDENCTTKEKGIFVAGDCRTKKIRQLTTAVSDGSIAAIGACVYIDSFKN